MRDTVRLVTCVRSLVTVFFLFTNVNPLHAQWIHSPESAGTYGLAFAVNGDLIFAGTNSFGVLLSTNNGESWTAVNSGLTSTFVSTLLANGSNLFAGTPSGVFLSTNNGANWIAGDTVAVRFVGALAVSGANLFAGNIFGVFLSTDNGTSWTAVNSGLPANPGISSFAASGENLFAGSGNGQGGVFLSTNNGTTWTQTGLTNGYVAFLALSGMNLFAGVSGAGVFLSTNNGTSWTAVNTGLTDFNLSSVAASDANLFVGTLLGGIFLSTNSGANWTAVNTGLTTVYIDALGVSSTHVFAGTNNGIWHRPLSEMITSVPFSSGDIPKGYKLEQNFPNPFNPSTTITYDLPTSSDVTLKLFDILGREVATLVDGEESAGTKSVSLNADNMASGVYLYRLQAGNFSQVRKMLVVK